MFCSETVLLLSSNIYSRHRRGNESRSAIEAAANLNCAVAVMNPLGGSIIPNHPDRFAFVKTRPAETVVEAALRFLINDPGITISLVGFSSREHIAEAISAVDGFKPISPAAVEKIRSSLQSSFNELCTSCRYCEGKCPQGIPVPKVMDAYNHYALLSPMEMINRLRWHWEIALKDDCLDQCTECSQCEDACTQKLPICERLKFIRSEIEKFLKSENAS